MLLKEQLKAFGNRSILHCFCFREKTPPRPQGQRPEPENRGVRKILGEPSRNEKLALEVSLLGLYFFFLDYKSKGKYVKYRKEKKKTIRGRFIWKGMAREYVPT